MMEEEILESVEAWTPVKTEGVFREQGVVNGVKTVDLKPKTEN